MPNEKSKGNIVTRFSDMEKSGKRTEWICSHGIGHHQGIHGCDGCCVDEPEMEKTTKDDFQRESIPSKNPMEENKCGLCCTLVPPRCKNKDCPCHQPPQEEDWEDTLREIIYSNWKKGDEVGLFVAVRSFIEARVQEVHNEYSKQNDGVLGRNIEYIKGVIKDVQKEERERILKAVKEKGLHLGYKNELLDIINNES